MSTPTSSPFLKRAYTQQEFSQHKIEELIRCQESPEYFLRHYYTLKTADGEEKLFEPYPYQLRFLRAMVEDRFVIGKIGRQLGKAQSLETPILTETGLKPLLNVHPGERVYGPDGKLTNVIAETAVMIGRPCFKITFSHGEEIIADAEHLWDVFHKRHRKLLTTQELYRVKKYSTSISIDNTLPISGQLKPNFDTYALGLWLGDGSSSSATVTCHEDDMEFYKSELARRGVLFSEQNISRKNVAAFTIKGLSGVLREALLKSNKHIPDEALFWSLENKLDFVRGLMDTDGYCSKDGKTCQFYQKDEKFIDDVRTLLSSLGITVHKAAKWYDQYQGYYYTLTFSSHYSLFHLPRKKERQKLNGHHPKIDRVHILKIEPIESVPVKCIQVDNASHQYLCGKTLIPTHNSSIVIAFLLHSILFFPNREILLLSKSEIDAIALLSRIKYAYEKIPLWMQQGVIKNDAKKFELENKSSIQVRATTEGAGRSGSYWCVFADEFAFVPGNLAHDFYSAAFPTVSSGKESKFVIVSTPNGMNLYYKLWMEAKSAKNSYTPIEAHWSEHPDRDENWARQMQRDLGMEKFSQEVLAEFLGSVDTLISSSKLRMIVHTEAIFEQDGYQLWELPKLGHKYVITVDVAEGIGRDYTVATVFDVTELPYRYLGKYRSNRVSPLSVPKILYSMAKQFNQAHVLIETGSAAAGIGDQVGNTLYFELEYENVFCSTKGVGRGGQELEWTPGKQRNMGVRTTRSTKAKGCASLKHLVENDQLIIPDFDLVEEMSNFKKIGNTFRAEEGQTDDIVMTCVIFGWLCKQTNFEDLTETKVVAHDEADLILPIVYDGLNDPDNTIIDIENNLLWQRKTTLVGGIWC